MFKGLHLRLTYIFIAISAGILVIASLLLIDETHYHFRMYQSQIPTTIPDMSDLGYHLEMAVVQSILWTLIGAILIVIIVCYFVAKRITAPLLEMREVAEQMSNGHLQNRIKISGHDELANLGVSLNQLAEQLQRQEQLRKNMTEDVAHELRTPLTTLKSHMEAFEDGIWEPTKERIHSCYEEIERLIHLVGDLEQLTMMESPEFTLHMKKEDFCSIVDQSVEIANASYLQKGVHLLFQKTNPVYLNLDRERFMQILMNLLSNSLKFTPPNGTVRIEILEQGDGVYLSICDTGSGIPEAELPYIFDRFYRVEKSRNRLTGGSGIGLTIVKKLVESHGGKLDVTSHEGEGTEVLMYFQKG